MKISTSILALVFLPFMLFGAGATVSTTSGVATNLTVVGGSGPGFHSQYSTNADTATTAVTATAATHANWADTASLSTNSIWSADSAHASVADVATAAISASTATTASGLTLTGNHNPIAQVIGYDASGVLATNPPSSLITNIYINPVLLETNIAFQMDKTNSIVQHYTNGYVYAPSNSVLGQTFTASNETTNTCTVTNQFGLIHTPIGTNNYFVLPPFSQFTFYNHGLTNY